MVISHRHTTIIKTLVISITLIAAGIGGWIYLQPISQAADLKNFDPGNIISDTVMSNKNSMTVQQIQAFLESKNSCNNTNTYMASWYPNLQYNIKDGKFVCMAKESFDGQSAAQIIWQVSQDYNINPQVLIVLLEKEQGLVTDTWPNHIQYRAAVGYACPDTAACDSQYYGLKNQLTQAAKLFRTVLDGGWSNYPVGQTYVQYNPNVACGGSVINIQNRATSALYRYTPYQPNQSALNAGYGTGDSCGAYGNRNFWLLFTDWFGSTINIGADAITTKYSNLGGKNSWLGDSTSGVQNTIRNGLVQSFKNGLIYWKSDTGAWTIRNGDISQRYLSVNAERGYLGFPLSDENPIRKSGIQTGVWQVFEGGQMYWSLQNKAWEVRYGAMFNRYSTLGREGSYLGYPKSKEVNLTNGVYQDFEGGRLYWSINNPSVAIDMSNDIVIAYERAGHSLGYLDSPISGTNCGIKNEGCWQLFKGGKIYWSADSGSFDVRHGDMDNKYAELKYEGGALGYPISREEKTGTTCGKFSDIRQGFQGGTLYWSACSNPTVRVELKN